MLSIISAVESPKYNLPKESTKEFENLLEKFSRIHLL